ncbi:arginase family protein, partial [Staphylococcus lugdunensis]|uniref:arginase family protein n=1 Tax=Staphylococcus lugdunensis TaxID=28035 RepID=UPI0030BADF03
IRYAGLQDRLENIGLNVSDRGNIDVTTIDLKKFNSEQEGLRNYDEIVQVSNTLSDKVDQTISNNSFPLVIGGDHSIA